MTNKVVNKVEALFNINEKQMQKNIKKVINKKVSENISGSSSKIASAKLVKIRQVKSGTGCIRSQVATLKGLGLGKINRMSELEDTSSVRGMINKVKHLLLVLE